MTTERPVLKARMGSPAAAKALIDKSSSDPRCPIFVCEGTVAEGGVGRISSCLNASSSGDAIEKKRARIPTPPSQLTHPIHRVTVEQEIVQPANAAKPTNNAKVFALAPISNASKTKLTLVGTFECQERLCRGQISCQAGASHARRQP